MFKKTKVINTHHIFDFQYALYLKEYENGHKKIIFTYFETKKKDVFDHTNMDHLLKLFIFMGSSPDDLQVVKGDMSIKEVYDWVHSYKFTINPIKLMFDKCGCNSKYCNSNLKYYVRKLRLDTIEDIFAIMGQPTDFQSTFKFYEYVSDMKLIKYDTKLGLEYMHTDEKSYLKSLKRNIKLDRNNTYIIPIDLNTKKCIRKNRIKY